MARRNDRQASADTRFARRRATGVSARSSQRSDSRYPPARQRSHGSSRPESSSHRKAYARGQGGVGKAPSAGTARASRASQAQRNREQLRVSELETDGRFGNSRSAHGAYRAIPGGHARDGGVVEYSETSVGELRRADRLKQAKKRSRRTKVLAIAIVGVVVALVIGGVALYNSSAFAITNVEVNGVEHLTGDEMAQLANVPSDSTLLRVDTATIEKRVKQNAWVSDVQVKCVFPDTLEINVTERSVFAVIEVPTSVGASVKQWAIASDHVWLMPIPDAGSDAAKTTSSKIYEDAARALHIIDVPFGTKAEIGEVCTDSNINNALDILSGLTTDLADRIVQVSAAGTAETTLILDNGVEVAFGKAEDIRDKERVVLQILADNEDNVAYINVRMVETPTWRAV